MHLCMKGLGGLTISEIVSVNERVDLKTIFRPTSCTFTINRECSIINFIEVQEFIVDADVARL